MCGIVGSLVFDKSSFEINEKYLTKMRDVMEHRGPDGFGLWISDNYKVGFGHRRLSIIDISTIANQPMFNEDNSICVVFNGEIYNHLEIRKELNDIGGHVWKTNHSDTEVILHSFEQWGIKCIDKFRGMFSIALWDCNKKELWLIRDRIGIKPLYYSIHNNRITFASEIKALFEDPDQEKKLNEQGFIDYLSFLTVPAPNTLFEGIYKLEAGSWMCVKSNGSVVKTKYWDVLDHIDTDIKKMNENDIANKLLKELRTSVKLRKISDVPVGVFLSGGIDSSTNTILFSENGKESVKTFSIGYDNNYKSYQNELIYAKEIAESVGAIYHERILTVDDLTNFLNKMIYLQDEPLGDSVCVPLFYLSKHARDNGVTVCQLGEGADELFWGYAGWKTILNFQKLFDNILPRFISNVVINYYKFIGKKDTWRFEYLNRIKSGLPAFWGGAEAFTQSQKEKILSKRLKSKFNNYTSWNSIGHIKKTFEEKHDFTKGLNWMTYIDLNLRLPELLLMRVDKMSMGVSLEGRVPFLDHKFVELAMSIPEEIKTKKGISKYILKKAIRNIVPDSIIDRKKQGFAAPIEEWFSDSLGDVANEQIKIFCENSDLLNWDEVSKILKSDRRSQAWPILNVALWWNIHFNKKNNYE
jgi:asparagine synthase (glutamine-hydrolysing)